MPNVLDVAFSAIVTAARADVCFAYDDCALRALRATVVSRAAVVRDCGDVLRATVLRAVAPRDVGWAVRDTVAPVRAIAVRASLRVVVEMADGVPDCRFMLVASRAAALATPMPAEIAPTKSKNFFIFT